MNILIIGSGGREHALAWAIAKSSRLTKLYIAPGNAGTEALGENISLNPLSPEEVAAAARTHKIDLAVIGPEAPLLSGVADALRAHGVPVFGPSAAAAAIEGSKIFAKEFMKRAQIPTARFGVFDDPAEARQYIERCDWPLVVKADGIAAGKGVFVCETKEEAREAVSSLMEKGSLKEAGRRVVIEERLSGKELSLFALTDGERAWLLPPARDHKTLYEGGRGPMTGGMGAFSPVPDVRDEEARGFFEITLRPAISGLAREGRPFCGVLYAGLMLTQDGPRVLEFNCRFGDPEAQIILPRARFDWLEVFFQAATGALPEAPPADAWDDAFTVGVVLAAEGYPARPATGDVISGIREAEESGAQIFIAGARREDGQVKTAGGRVLTVVARGKDLAEARQRAYTAAEHISFRGKQFRSDIGA